eukprot:g4221.t1
MKLILTLELIVIGLFSFIVASTQAEKKGYTCGEDGFWYQDGKKTEYTYGCSKDAKDKDGTKDSSTKAKTACTRSEDPEMPKEYPKTCISGPPDAGLRCWWTYVPAKVKAASSTLKVPLVVDMHGGGGCASHQALSSGFRELADSLDAKDSFVIIWPQGYNNQWGTCGSDCDKTQAESKGKDIHTTDDVTFISALIAYAIKNDDSSNPSYGVINPEKVYTTGFSMGCMMSHRLALERSSIIAGFGGHGGRLIQLGSDLNAERSRFNLQAMPAYMTGGTVDDWFEKRAYVSWTSLNQCAVIDPNDNITLLGTNKESKAEAMLYSHSSCAGDVRVVRLEIINGTHVPDSRMAKLSYDFLKSYSRNGALEALGDWSIYETSLGSDGARNNLSILISLALIVGFFMGY